MKTSRVAAKESLILEKREAGEVFLLDTPGIETHKIQIVWTHVFFSLADSASFRSVCIG